MKKKEKEEVAETSLDSDNLNDLLQQLQTDPYVKGLGENTSDDEDSDGAVAV